jgi:hydroxypyruvate isomerase
MLQFDAYHTERMDGDAPGRLRAVIDRVAHIQIADNPGRHQPGTGELDFKGLFAAIEDVGYTGWVGLEYIPSDGTVESLTWLDQFGFSLA